MGITVVLGAQWGDEGMEKTHSWVLVVGNRSRSWNDRGKEGGGKKLSNN